jgi:hypothetical protein
MPHAACSTEDIIAAFQDLVVRLDTRRHGLWNAYREATSSMSRGEYQDHEHECWSVLSAGLAGIDAEQRVLTRDFERRMQQLQRPTDTSLSA